MTGNDRSTRVLLSVIACLLGANLLVNMNNNSGPRTAYAAGIPDQGAQLQSVIDSVNEVGKKVDKIDAYLESGALTVKVQDNKAAK